MPPPPNAPPPIAADNRLAWHRGALYSALIAAAWSAVLVAKLVLHPDLPRSAPLAAVFGLGFFSIWLSIGSLWAVVAFGHPRVRSEWARRGGGLALLAVAATLVGIGVGDAIERLHGPHEFRVEILPYVLFRQGVLAVLLVAMFEFGRHQARAADALHLATLRRAALQTEYDAARHALLQAQIEPHFLFNSLANVRRLLRTDAPAAQTLLAALRRYLEEALPLLRQPRTTLGREADLIAAYLAVHQVRMGPRLKADIDVPAALADYELPSMLLLTLVENAIKHGLAPLVEGGSVRIAARRDDEGVTLTVSDTGRGMGAGMGHGTGLSNLVARLKASYGGAARLSLRLNEPQGVVAELHLPLAPPASSNETPR